MAVKPGNWTNEELVSMIQAGEDNYLPVLWGNCRRILYTFALEFRGHLEKQSYLDIDDLVSCGYFAILQAVKRYDVTRGRSFTSFLKFAFWDQAYAAFGNKTRVVNGKQQKYIPEGLASLNELVEYKNNQYEVSEFIEDETVDIEGDYEQEELRRVVAAAIDELEPKEQFLIRAMYFEGKKRRDLKGTKHFERLEQIDRTRELAFYKLKLNKELEGYYHVYFRTPEPPTVKDENIEMTLSSLEDWDKWLQEAREEFEVIEYGLLESTR